MEKLFGGPSGFSGKGVRTGLREMGCPKINLQIRRGNDKIASFYQKLGFTKDHVVSMGKQLEADHS